jgi:hypothetical protein
MSICDHQNSTSQIVVAFDTAVDVAGIRELTQQAWEVVGFVEKGWMFPISADQLRPDIIVRKFFPLLDGLDPLPAGDPIK